MIYIDWYFLVVSVFWGMGSAICGIHWYEPGFWIGHTSIILAYVIGFENDL